MISIGIVEPDGLLHSSIKQSLERTQDFNVTFECLNGRALIRNIELLNSFPSLVLINVRLPDISWRDALMNVAKHHPKTKIIALAEHPTGKLVGETIRSGADGFLSTQIDKQEIIHGVRQVLLNNLFICIARNEYRVNIKTLAGGILLTDKQKLFLKYCAEDLKYKEIAEILHISLKTADRYRDDLFRKLNVKSKVGLALFAVKAGLIDL